MTQIFEFLALVSQLKASKANRDLNRIRVRLPMSCSECQWVASLALEWEKRSLHLWIPIQTHHWRHTRASTVSDWDTETLSDNRGDPLSASPSACVRCGPVPWPSRPLASDRWWSGIVCCRHNLCIDLNAIIIIIIICITRVNTRVEFKRLWSCQWTRPPISPVYHWMWYQRSTIRWMSHHEGKMSDQWPLGLPQAMARYIAHTVNTGLHSSLYTQMFAMHSMHHKMAVNCLIYVTSDRF